MPCLRAGRANFEPTMQENNSKLLEIKHGNKTTYCFKKPEADLEQKDLTTSGRHSIGYSDIPKEQWDKIFKKKMKE
jgi:hypothetical protein